LNSQNDGDLEIKADGNLLRFPAVWLRDNCPCPDCLDPVSGQKLKDITELPDGLAVSTAEGAGDTVIVTYAPDAHRSAFSRAWLARHALSDDGPRAGGALSDDGPGAGGAGGELGGRTEDDGKEFWLPADLGGLPAASWPRYLADPAHRARALDAVLRWGFVLLHDVPAEPGLVLEVATSFGFVRETNYGRLFDVRVETTPANLANACLPIGPHTDNPYREPAPTIQLLHCLTNAASGGEPGLLDGFRAAAQLRAEDPGAFECLTRASVTFAYADATADLRASRPMIEVNPAGLIRGVRYNSRSMQPMRPRAGATPARAAEEMREFYLAYRAFAAILVRPYLTVRFDLAPGDCVVFDNTRVLHSRTGLAAMGERHLQGCYADIDGAESTVAVLARSCSRHAARDSAADANADERRLTAAG
jgi:gamma-butyrobetaine dioxygenase